MMGEITKSKVLKFIAGFIVGCIIMLAVIVGMYFYMGSRESASVLTNLEGGAYAMAFLCLRKIVSSEKSHNLN